MRHAARWTASLPMLVLPLVFSAAHAAAQQPESVRDTAGAAASATMLTPGTRVRVTQEVTGSGRVVGTLVSADATRLTLDRGSAEPWGIEAPAVLRLQVSEGRRTTGQGAMRGAARGAIGGLALTGVLLLGGALADANGGANDGPCDYFCFNGKQNALIVGVPLTVLTTTAGAVLGAAAPGERWRAVRLPVRTAPAAVAASCSTGETRPPASSSTPRCP